MLGLTPLGAFHTAIGLIAVICGFVALARDRQISSETRLGRVYLVTTLVTAVTALGIFRHGGFGPPHVLSARWPAAHRCSGGRRRTSTPSATRAQSCFT